MYIHTRVGHTDSQHNLFDSEKVFLVLLAGFEPSTFGSPVQRSNTEPTRHPTLPVSLARLASV